MTKKRRTPKAKPAAPKPPSLVEQLAKQGEQEVIQRAGDEGRARGQAAQALGLEPGAPDEAAAPKPHSRAEQVAERVEREAIDRGSDEFLAHRQLVEALGLEPEPPAPVTEK